MGAPGKPELYIIKQYEEDKRKVKIVNGWETVEQEKLGVDYNIELPVIKLNGKEVIMMSTPEHKSFFKRG